MFVTFEGIDASGKTTQLQLLANALRAKGFSVLETRQPGGTRIGQLLRQILLNPEHSELVPETEVLLYMADRIQHIREMIQPALKRGEIVLCDRYHDATLAYQGGGRQLDLSWLKPLQDNHIVSPDLTLWFDIGIEQSQARLRNRNETLDTENCRLESENAAFFNRVKSAYARMSRREPERYLRIDADGDIDVIQRQVLKAVLDRMD